MSAKNKEKTEPSSLVEDGEYPAPLVYNLWINATTINVTVEDGGTVILQTGTTKDPKPPNGGG